MCAPCAPSPQKQGEPSYPSFSIADEVMDAFLKEHPVDLGDVVTGRVKLKVTAMSKEKWGSRVQFDVLDLSGVKERSFDEKSPEDQFDQLKREAESDAEEKAE